MVGLVLVCVATTPTKDNWIQFGYSGLSASFGAEDVKDHITPFNPSSNE